MNILIIGGTRFQGRYLVDQLISHGHKVTVFHRGNHPANFPVEVEVIHGDRNIREDLQKLQTKSFDWLVDTCAYVPSQCDLVLKTLGHQIHKLCFVSSSYVYTSTYPRISEIAELKKPEYRDEKISAASYGPLKVACEERYSSEIGQENVLILRPSVLIGPGDHTMRLQFWIEALAGPKLYTLVDPNRKIQLLDVRDYTNFFASALERNLTGVFNLAGHPEPLTDIVEFIQSKKMDEKLQRRTIDWELFEHNSISRSEIPYALPIEGEDYCSEKAKTLGFNHRPIHETLADCLGASTNNSVGGEMSELLRRFQKIMS